jgi:hypothetical protein
MSDQCCIILSWISLNSVNSALMSMTDRFDFSGFVRGIARAIATAEQRSRRIESDNAVLSQKLILIQADVDKYKSDIEALQCRIERINLESEDYRGRIG